MSLSPFFGTRSLPSPKQSFSGDDIKFSPPNFSRKLLASTQNPKEKSFNFLSSKYFFPGAMDEAGPVNIFFFRDKNLLRQVQVCKQGRRKRHKDEFLSLSHKVAIFFLPIRKRKKCSAYALIQRLRSFVVCRVFPPSSSFSPPDFFLLSLIPPLTRRPPSPQRRAVGRVCSISPPPPPLFPPIHTGEVLVRLTLSPSNTHSTGGRQQQRESVYREPPPPPSSCVQFGLTELFVHRRQAHSSLSLFPLSPPPSPRYVYVVLFFSFPLPFPIAVRAKKQVGRSRRRGGTRLLHSKRSERSRGRGKRKKRSSVPFFEFFFFSPSPSARGG